MITKPPLGMAVNQGSPLAKNLGGCWLFNEGGGNKIFDSSGYASTGTFVAGANAPSWTPGCFGSALLYSGNSTYVTVPTNTHISANGPMTISAWAKATAPGSSKYIANKVAESPNRGFGLYTGSGNIAFFVYDTNNVLQRVSSATNPWDGFWHHFVGVFDISTVKIFTDGVQKDSVNTDGLSIGDSSAQDMVFGYTTSGFSFPGSIDNIAYWNRALSGTEVAMLYANPFCMMRKPNPRRKIIRGATGGVTYASAMTLLGVG